MQEENTMATDRKAQFQTETPFLPEPLQGDVLEAAVRPAATLADAEAQQAHLAALRIQLSAAVDTVDLAIANNHADYLGGRRCWSYETSNEVKLRLRILKRQMQQLQDAYGRCNRRIKHLEHVEAHQPREDANPNGTRALRFVQAAEVLLDAETVAMLWEMVEQEAGQNGRHEHG
jgi:hypothetical protein